MRLEGQNVVVTKDGDNYRATLGDPAKVSVQGYGKTKDAAIEALKEALKRRVDG